MTGIISNNILLHYQVSHEHKVAGVEIADEHEEEEVSLPGLVRDLEAALEE